MVNPPKKGDPSHERFREQTDDLFRSQQERAKITISSGLVGLGTFPFLIFPIDIVQKFFNPRQAFILHYVGISMTLLMHYKYSQYFKRLPKIFETFYTWALSTFGLIFVYLAFNYNGKLFDLNRNLLFGLVLFIVGLALSCALGNHWIKMTFYWTQNRFRHLRDHY